MLFCTHRIPKLNLGVHQAITKNLYWKLFACEQADCRFFAKEVKYKSSDVVIPQEMIITAYLFPKFLFNEIHAIKVCNFH